MMTNHDSGAHFYSCVTGVVYITNSTISHNRLHPRLHHAVGLRDREEDGPQAGVGGVGAGLHSGEQRRGGVLGP